MRCSDTGDCFNQIGAYFDGKKTGHFLLVNTENYDIYQLIRHRLEADERIDYQMLMPLSPGYVVAADMPSLACLRHRCCVVGRNWLQGLSRCWRPRSVDTV